jgi:hypothetical protein
VTASAPEPSALPAATTAVLADAATTRGGIGAGLRRSFDYVGLVPFAVFVSLFLLWPTLMVVVGAFQVVVGQERRAPGVRALVR